jgi:PAS domain S-box-containing protein
VPDSQAIFYELFEFAPDAIVVVDRDGRITRANAKTEELFGWSREELVDRPVEVLIPARFAAHVGYRSRYLAEPRARPMGAGLELYARRKDGTEVPVDIMLSPVQTERDRLVLAVVRDVTERKIAEARVREALQRERRLKEIHHKEIHHRVKNNLQVISSLLFLQSTYGSDLAAQEMLKESQGRVKSIALIHEKLYRSESVDTIDYAEYVRDLVTDLLRTYSVEQRDIAVHVGVDNVHLGIDTAIPCGLIVNELVSNVLKHAFPAGRKGSVRVELRSAPEERYVLAVRDDGVGLPAGLDWRRAHSLGLKLVADLTKQLGGVLEVESGDGTAFRVTFAEVRYKERE